MKIIKSEKRTSLNNDTLDDLLAINADEIPLTQFDPDKSIDLWWSTKTRRPNQHERREYAKRQHSGQSSSMETSEVEADW